MSDKFFDTFDDFVKEFDREPNRRRLYRRDKPRYTLVAELIRLRTEAGLTQQELASKLGKHQSSVARMESGEHDIKLSTLTEVAEALNAHVELRLVKNYEVTMEEWKHLVSMPTGPVEAVDAIRYSSARSPEAAPTRRVLMKA